MVNIDWVYCLGTINSAIDNALNTKNQTAHQLTQIPIDYLL